jgi:hypothetical protein
VQLRAVQAKGVDVGQDITGPGRRNRAVRGSGAPQVAPAHRARHSRHRSQSDRSITTTTGRRRSVIASWSALAPLAALPMAWVHQRLLDHIEPFEHVYHRNDVPSRLDEAPRRTSARFRPG